MVLYAWISAAQRLQRMVIMSVLKCPVCSFDLIRNDKCFKCNNNHSFDIAKEGYVNLLSAHKSGDNVGDNKDMARFRRDFLNKGYFSTLADAVGDCLKKYTKENDTVLDICCGEGYYTEHLSNKFSREYYGFDISKNMVRLAAKRKCGANFFVANISSIPVKSESVNFAFHLFAPFHSEEFARILSKNGVIVTAIPGKEHLYEIKEVLYDEPYFNDEKPPQAGDLKLVEKMRAKTKIDLNSNEDIMSLFRMTPYFYHTPSEGMKRLEECESLTTTIDFVLLVYKR